jgi:GntR family transcriptional regulator
LPAFYQLAIKYGVPPLDLELDYDRGVPVYRQIYEAVVAALAGGALERDEQLPTIHDLARRLDVNPNTVAHAYRELERDGYLVSRRGRGTFAAEIEAPPAGARRAILAEILDRALAEAARNRIGAEEALRFFRKART